MLRNTMLPALTHRWSTEDGQLLPVKAGPGLDASAIDSLRARFPGSLTPEFQRVLRHACGLEGTPLGYIDFTGLWHEPETLSVFRPCLTLAVDSHGRRWIAETGSNSGLPGPVWCVLQHPQAVVYVSADVGEFLQLLKHHSCEQSLPRWLKALDAAGESAWSQRGALAFCSRQEPIENREVRQWLLQLPRDARVYDLRSPRCGVAWPYGAAGAEGELHRCGRELLFAVSGFPAPSRWVDYVGHLAQHYDPPRPAIMSRQV